ncbi:MAG: DUF2726 domain-containing protein [Patescibacteria group bacterium]
MEKIIVLFIILGIIAVLAEIFPVKLIKHAVTQKYQYGRKKFFMSRAEHECYDALMVALGKEYYVFPQVHLSTILDNKIPGQNWNAALRHINQKSVDFVLCDKSYIAPVLTIELDDSSHERKDRIDRDHEVERILKQANLPLLRIINNGRFDPLVIAEQVETALNSK